jgi:hypothetical protein
MPLRTCVEKPQDCFKNATCRDRLASGTTIGNVFLRKMIPDPLPLLVRESNHPTFIADRLRPAILSDFEYDENAKRVFASKIPIEHFDTLRRSAAYRHALPLRFFSGVILGDGCMRRRFFGLYVVVASPPAEPSV